MALATVTRWATKARTAVYANVYKGPPGQLTWTAYSKAGELVGINVNEPMFGKEAELNTHNALAQGAAKGYIVTDPAGQNKLWNQAYYTVLWEYVGCLCACTTSVVCLASCPTCRANNGWLLAKKDYETIRAAIQHTSVMDYNLKTVRWCWSTCCPPPPPVTGDDAYPVCW